MKRIPLIVFALVLVSCASVGSNVQNAKQGPYTNDPVAVGTYLERRLVSLGYITTDRTQEEGTGIDLLDSGQGTLTVRSTTSNLEYRVSFSYTYETRLFFFRYLKIFKLEAREVAKPKISFSLQFSEVGSAEPGVDDFASRIKKLGY